jgi:hypothetical protein
MVILNSDNIPELKQGERNNLFQILFHSKKAVNNFNKKSRWILFTKNQIAIGPAERNTGESRVINFDFFFFSGNKRERS